MSVRVAGCAPQAGATAQHPDADATDTATPASVCGAASTLTGSELRAQLRAQQGRNRFTQPHSVEAQRVAPAVPESAHYRWRVILADGTAFEVCCLPEQTAVEMRELYRGATVLPMPDAADTAGSTKADQNRANRRGPYR